ncbi:MAG: hypothetical protein JWL70_2762, partial [Acidimicrobiia bacterium]|nr:hypothetical protein [Acidimicrobiia bacterium]
EHMNLLRLVVLDSATWAAMSVVVGYGAHRLPATVLETDTALTALRSWERDGRIYEAVGVRRWKDLLPEAGGFFAGGISKRSLWGGDGVALAGFAAETRRAELVHWTLLALGPVFLWWNPWPLGVSMMIYAVAANLPFVAVQRFNRGRLLRVAVLKSKREEARCVS